MIPVIHTNHTRKLMHKRDSTICTHLNIYEQVTTYKQHVFIPFTDSYGSPLFLQIKIYKSSMLPLRFEKKWCSVTQIK